MRASRTRKTITQTHITTASATPGTPSIRLRTKKTTRTTIPSTRRLGFQHAARIGTVRRPCIIRLDRNCQLSTLDCRTGDVTGDLKSRLMAEMAGGGRGMARMSSSRFSSSLVHDASREAFLCFPLLPFLYIPGTLTRMHYVFHSCDQGAFVYTSSTIGLQNS